MVRIDTEFKNLIPPLTAEEYAGLETSILEEGCRDALIVWGDTLIDGHNRYEICTRHNIPFETSELFFKDRNEAIVWIIKNQFGRRNLPAYERARLALRLKPVIAERAKERQLAGVIDLPKKSGEGAMETKIAEVKAQNLSKEAERYFIDRIVQDEAKEQRLAKMAAETHIYFMRIDDKMKVGSSSDVESRMKQLRVTSPTIEIVGDVLFGEGAKKHENILKTKFAKYHIGGEMYVYSDNALAEMMAFTRREAARNKETDTIIARAAGVSHDTIAKVEKIEAKAAPEVKEQLRAGEISINQAYQAVKREEKKQEVQQRIEEYANVQTGVIDIKEPGKKYNIIYADPPWQYWESGNKNQALHYTTMTIDEICDLPVKDIAADDCVLFLWVTYPVLQEAFRVIESWGFSYSTAAFVWVKKNKHQDTPFIGCGAWTRANSELCLLATKGNVMRLDASVSQVIESPIEEHSKKPDVTRELITKLVGELPRVELFCRHPAKGWDVWGNEA